MSIILKEIIMHVLMRKTQDKREREREREKNRLQVGVASAGRPRNSADWCVYGGHADWWPW